MLSLPKILYHATITDRVSRVMETGILPREHHQQTGAWAETTVPVCEKSVYMHLFLGEAHSYIKNVTTNCDVDSMTLMEIDTSQLDPDLFTIDHEELHWLIIAAWEDWIEAGRASEAVGCEIMDLVMDIGDANEDMILVNQKLSVDARRTLTQHAIRCEFPVQYMGPIPVSAITIGETRDSSAVAA